MKKLFLLLASIFCNLYFSFSQSPLVKQWDYRYGGTDFDIFSMIKETRDHGFILAGYSYSGISGDKTQPNWDVSNQTVDYWIVKVDSNGVKQWDKRFGGDQQETFFSIDTCKDGGYILGGSSNSDISGDKTQANWDASLGTVDYWIVKIDSLGIKLWDKRFGGIDDDQFSSLLQTNDGGYILGGDSKSGISGDKTQDIWGNVGDHDYWIVKIDSLGNKQWDRDFGGTDGDDLHSIKQTVDSGYVLIGSSLSGISGVKTQANWGTWDYWIIKIDSLGNKIWDKDFGSLSQDDHPSLEIASDGGYILAGTSFQGTSGNKTQAGNGDYDYWIIKMDSSGNQLWDKSYGGSAYEFLDYLEKTSDGGFLLSGNSRSPISGDKTESNLGVDQSWVIKIDTTGSKQWDKTLRITGNDNIGYAIQSHDGCYVIGNFTTAGIGGDKTQANWDLTNATWDYWIIKFCDTSITTAFVVQGTPLCPGTCTNFTNLSQNATSYQWIFAGASPGTSTDINPQSICYNTPGSYDVTLIATNASGSDTLTLANYITVFPYPPPQGITQNGDTLFANQGAVSYQWYFNGNLISASTNYFYVAQASGDYNVVCTDGNGCEVEAVIFNVISAIASQPNQSEGVEIYPNPVGEKLFVKNYLLIGTTGIKIYNVLGENVLNFPIEIKNKKQESEIDVHSLPNGVYWLEGCSGENFFRSKFVKE